MTDSTHYIFRLIRSISFLLAILMLGSCAEEKKYRIGVSQCSSDDWRDKMNEEMLREIMLHEDATIEIRSANDDNERQIADIRYFADNNFDAIICSPIEAKAITPVIKEVYQQGIPVIIFDRDIEGDTYTARISTDNEAIGRMAGSYVAAKYPNPDGSPIKVLELSGNFGSSPTNGRHSGFFEALGDRAILLNSPVTGKWNREDAARATDSLLRIFPDVDLIYAHNDRMAIGASEVATNMGFGQVPVIGVDAAPNIGIKAVADSVIDATFLYPTEGHLPVQTALRILHGEQVEKEIVLPATSAVDRSNADILLVQNNALIEETGKMKELKNRIDDYWTRHSAQTSLFYASLAILALVLLSLFLLLRAYWTRRRNQELLEDKNRLLFETGEEQKRLAEAHKKMAQKQIELNEQLQEAMGAKLTFYTNVSHDLRTPLTLIVDPVEQLAKADNLTEKQRRLIRLADKNVKILRRLINQILDFRKYENGRLELNLAEVDFNGVLSEYVDSFKEIARSRDLKLIYKPGDPLTLAVDPEKMERIFFNLISNAVKYTPQNGTITISYRAEGDKLIACVADTGIGIPREELGNIFERFFMVDSVHPHGSGIGLSLVKAFVELHEGSITVESQVEKGSVFTITLPIRHIADTAVVPAKQITDADVQAELAIINPSPETSPRGAAPESAETPAHRDATEESPEDSAPERRRLLVVDDNADIRALVRELLGDEYEIFEAVNGKEGVAKAARLVPDLVVCDIMMPVMDGFECCRRIKNELSTSHIPVLMLTACSMDQQRVEGYESGADGYVSKPFSSDVLRARVRSLISNRRRIQEIYGSQASLGTLPATGASSPAKGAGEAAGIPADLDNEFYARFLEVFNREIGNPDLSIEQVAAELGLGHSQFYRKIKALTNYTPVELMRQLRLKRARTLLTTTSRSISEIAYEVGFSSPAYFTKCYRSAFGETPTTLRDTLGQK